MPHDLPILAARLREMRRAAERRRRKVAALLEDELHLDVHARGLDEDDVDDEDDDLDDDERR